MAEFPEEPIGLPLERPPSYARWPPKLQALWRHRHERAPFLLSAGELVQEIAFIETKMLSVSELPRTDGLEKVMQTYVERQEACIRELDSKFEDVTDSTE